MTPRTAVLIACSLFALALPATWYVDSLRPRTEGTLRLARKLSESIPLELAGWTGTETPLTDQEIEIIRLDDHVKRTYRGPGGEQVVLYVTYHGNKERGLQTYFHNASVCYREAGYERVRTDFENVVLSDLAKEIPVCRYVFQRGASRLSVMTFFRVDNELLEQSPRNKPFWMLLDRLRPQLDDSPGTFVQVQVITLVKSEDDYAAGRLGVRFLEVFGKALFDAIQVSGAVH